MSRERAWGMMVFGVVVLALAVQGCSHTMVPDKEYRQLVEMREYNNTLTGRIKTLEVDNERLTNDLNGANDKLKDANTTIVAQRNVLDTMENAINRVKEQEKTIKDMTHDVGEGFGPGVTVSPGQGGVVIDILGDVLFATGSFAIKTSAEPSLDKIAGVLKNRGEKIRVGGYTDSDPVKPGAILYKDNMELSTLRAIAVWRYLEKKGVSVERMSVAGYGATHLKKDSKGVEDKAASRRVEIVILAPQAEVAKSGG